MKKQKISLKYIAQELGLSPAVVSVVLNNKTGSIRVSEENRKRIQDFARKVNYRPNTLARSLKTGKSHTLGLLVPDISNTYYSLLARSVEDNANRHGYPVIFCSSDEDPQKEEQLITVFRERKVDGMLIAGTQKNEEIIHSLEKEGYPFILIDRSYPTTGASFVGINNRKGSFDAVSHLLDQGYRRIAMLTTYPHLSPIRDRETGYREALQSFGIPSNDHLRCEIDYSRLYESIKEKFEELLALEEKPDALYVLNNKIAMVALQVIDDAGYTIPNDLAFLCFDDQEFFPFFRPSITAVSHSAEKVGERAVELLLDQINAIEEKPGKLEVILPTQLIKRQSTENTN